MVFAVKFRRKLRVSQILDCSGAISGVIPDYNSCICNNYSCQQPFCTQKSLLNCSAFTNATPMTLFFQQTDECQKNENTRRKWDKCQKRSIVCIVCYFATISATCAGKWEMGEGARCLFCCCYPHFQCYYSRF